MFSHIVLLRLIIGTLPLPAIPGPVMRLSISALLQQSAVVQQRLADSRTSPPAQILLPIKVRAVIRAVTLGWDWFS